VLQNGMSENQKTD